MNTIKRKPSKGSQIFGLIVTVIFLIFFGTCLFENKSKPADTNSISTPTEVVFNDSYDGRVKQVREYLRENLKDWDSYESVKWYKVQKYTTASDIIGLGKLTKNVLPKTGPGKNFPNDEDGIINKEDYDKIYILAKAKGYVKIRIQPNDSIYMKSNGLNYWAGWVPQNAITTIEVDAGAAVYSVRHKYRAKNSLGGYVISDQTFYLDKNGNVIRVEDMGDDAP